jgi:SAM-dependent methyltransferase
MATADFKTRQQEAYEADYRDAADAIGFPDRKIVAGDPSGQRILSIGCGLGNDLWYLVAKNEVVGLDYAGSGLEVAARHGLRTVEADLNLHPSLPFEDAAFDVVVMKDILEHLLDPLAVLREVHRVLKPDGYAVVSLPNPFVWSQRLRVLFGGNLVYRGLVLTHADVYDEWNYMHIRFFTYRGVKRFLAAAGFRPVRWFWDFGNLAHYQNPDMWFEPQWQKRAQGLPLSRRARLAVRYLRPCWMAFNVIFPRALRRLIVGAAPGLLCGGFYLWAKKTSTYLINSLV